jgi:hypothetical protein
MLHRNVLLYAMSAAGLRRVKIRERLKRVVQYFVSARMSK